MPNPTKRDNDVSKLHPAIRDKVIEIQETLEKENIPLRVYEAFRTPELQVEYAKRKPPITWVGPWRSIHQYGLAVDFVAFENGNWSWDTSGGREKWWLRMHALAKERGMRPLRDKNGNLKELAHIQHAKVSSSDLAKGIYPAGGDHVWAECLCDMIDNWRGDVPAPARPENLPERPPIPEEQRGEVDLAGLTEAALPGVLTAATDDRFRRLHAFIKEAEGGFANHPDDPGGPTNLGITIETLKVWRGKDVTTDDVKSLTQAEADEIFRTNYYMECRCAEMPIQVAMVVYNAAVMSGPGKAVRLLQESFNGMGMTIRDGANPDAPSVQLEVDGIIGPNTLAAATQTDSAALSSAYLDNYTTYLRTLSQFSTFGRGWMNRIGKLREFVTNLPHEAGKRPEKVMKVQNKLFDLDLELDDLLGAAVTGVKSGDPKRALATLLAQRLLEQDDHDTARSQRIKMLTRAALARKLDIPAVGPDGKEPLTPVNAALGEGIGRFLDGKKSAIGVVGILLTVFVPQLGVAGPLIDFVRGNYSEILTVLATFTGWGFLGKIDKAIRETRL